MNSGPTKLWNRNFGPGNFIVFSHLRWNFVFQRPQHLMSRCAKANNVLFCEEPVFDTDTPFWDVSVADSGVRIAVPHLPGGLNANEVATLQSQMLAELFTQNRIEVANAVLWFYTPMALNFAPSKARVVVYDCMDELSAFQGASLGLPAAEAELFRRADLVFTGGQSLFAVKRDKHPSVHCFPSSIDLEFFSAAKQIKKQTKNDPYDQKGIGGPRLGYAGVIDERMDLALLAAIADTRRDWNLIMLGPVVKINPCDLPQRPNIHYLGAKPYRDLPAYMSQWDVALLPFALNESTKFISPTKTPEYLAAGLPVVSTPIADVVHPYAEREFVRIGKSHSHFIEGIQDALDKQRSSLEMAELDRFLAENSWDQTWNGMSELIEKVSQVRPATARGETRHRVLRPIPARSIAAD